jgi:RHS repeat-associated protein
VIDNQGAIVWDVDVDPFGYIESVVAGSADRDPHRRYPGQWSTVLDPAVSLTTIVYNTYRWYEPHWGRYIQADPIGLNGGVNLYVYVANRPLNSVDPEGRQVNAIRCTYYLPKCADRSLDCADFWRCKFAEMGLDEQLDLFQRASVAAERPITSESAFLYWFCFETVPQCEKALEYCGTLAVKPPFGGKPS